MKELIEIQSKLNVPKNQKNKFGGFNYRSAEDILEALKPLTKERGCYVMMTDSIKNIGDRYYVETTAIITNEEGKSKSAIGVAREEENKKGMDAAQITGSASSYARKRALSGLFALDDSDDPDRLNNTDSETSNAEADILAQVESAETVEALEVLFRKHKGVFANQNVIITACAERKKTLQGGAK